MRILGWIYFAISIMLLESREAVGQSKPYFSVSGIVVDSASSQPVVLATVSLVRDAHVLASTTTNSSGLFVLRGTDQLAHLEIKRSNDKAASKLIPLPQTGADQINLGTILFSSGPKELKEITVKASRQLVKQDIDRLTYSVKDDPESQTGSTFDILRKVPLISIENNQSIVVNGRQSYVILVNGKPSTILSQDPATALQNQKAINIDHIEVITTPSSKYSQNKITEVINIVTKGTSVSGQQANVRATGTTTDYLTASLTADIERDWIGFTVYNSLISSHFPLSKSYFYTVPNDPSVDATHQEGSSRRSSHSVYIIPEASMQLDSLDMILVSAEYRRAPSNSTDQLFTHYNNNTANFYNSVSNSGFTDGSSAYNFYFQHQGKSNKNRVLSAGYRFSRTQREASYVIDQFDYYGNSSILQANDFSANEHTLQLDYSHPLKVLTIEAGGKAIFRANESVSNSVFASSPAENIAFADNDNAFMAYNSYYWKKGNWGIKVAIRDEYTDIISPGHHNVYNNLVPNANLQLKVKSGILSLAVDQDIIRPSIYQLNSFTNLANPALNTAGNANLRPSVTYRFELNYNINNKNFTRLTGYYNTTRHEISSFLTALNDTTSIISYYNSGERDELGIRYSGSVKFGKSFDVGVNSRVTYVREDGYVSNVHYASSGVEAFVTTNFSYLFKDGWRGSLYLRSSSPYVDPQGRGFWWVDESLSLNKRFLSNALSCSLSVEDPLNEYRNRRSSTYLGTFDSFRNTQELVRRVSLSVSYQLGSLKYQIKRTRKTISNTDLKSEN